MDSVGYQGALGVSIKRSDAPTFSCLSLHIDTRIDSDTRKETVAWNILSVETALSGHELPRDIQSTNAFQTPKIVRNELFQTTYPEMSLAYFPQTRFAHS
jgi:hypothetical protein